MPPILPLEWHTLYNWIIAGLIGAICGIVGATVTHYYDRKRDNIVWQRRLEEVEREWQRREEEREKEREQDQREAIRQRLTADIEDPKAFKDALVIKRVLRSRALPITITVELVGSEISPEDVAKLLASGISPEDVAKLLASVIEEEPVIVREEKKEEGEEENEDSSHQQ